MIRLGIHGKASRALDAVVLGRITHDPVPEDVRKDYVLAGGPLPADLRGYAGALSTEPLPSDSSPLARSIYGLETLDHLADGDVVALNPSGYVRTLYRLASRHNAIFATDRCNSYCLMCSQPPKDVDDSHVVAEHLRLIELMSPEIAELGITGGEPTLLKDGLVTVIRRCKELLPAASLHVLSNGRLFYYSTYARRVAEIKHRDLMFGIPLYSDIDSEHDYVVQSKGAFDDTMVGLHNLGRYGIRAEVRVVIHALTYRRLPELAEYIYRNVPFASHVALMGLELMGFAVPNLSQLWVDPWDYRRELEAATLFLADRGMTVSIYNHQLCVVPESIWPYCRQSISDWKSEFAAVCSGCAVQPHCGGFFTSSLQRRTSAHIAPISMAPGSL
jgi:His-Xaa-Ser system radical SAM maturase HxsC